MSKYQQIEHGTLTRRPYQATPSHDKFLELRSLPRLASIPSINDDDAEELSVYIRAVKQLAKKMKSVAIHVTRRNSTTSGYIPFAEFEKRCPTNTALEQESAKSDVPRSEGNVSSDYQLTGCACQPRKCLSEENSDRATKLNNGVGECSFCASTRLENEVTAGTDERQQIPEKEGVSKKDPLCERIKSANEAMPERIQRQRKCISLFRKERLFQQGRILSLTIESSEPRGTDGSVSSDKGSCATQKLVLDSLPGNEAGKLRRKERLLKLHMRSMEEAC